MREPFREPGAEGLEPTRNSSPSIGDRVRSPHHLFDAADDVGMGGGDVL